MAEPDKIIISHGITPAITKQCPKRGKVWEKYINGRVIMHIAVDTNNRIVIRQSKSEKITVLNPAGEKLFSFPETSTHNLVPYGICIDSKNNILVADRTSKSILLYSSEGKYLGKVLNADGMPYIMALYDDQYLCVRMVEPNDFRMYNIGQQ